MSHKIRWTHSVREHDRPVIEVDIADIRWNVCTTCGAGLIFHPALIDSHSVEDIAKLHRRYHAKMEYRWQLFKIVQQTVKRLFPTVYKEELSKTQPNLDKLSRIINE